MSITSTYNSLFVFFCSIYFCTNSFAQDSTFKSLNFDTSSHLNKLNNISTIKQFNNLTYPYNKKRVRAVAIANVVGYGAIMYGLSSAWYSGFAKSKMHSFNDNGEWLQIDKIGHALSAYAESQASYEVWRWTGISRKKRILLGGLSGAVFQTIIETLDGFSADWGWSWGDFGANIIGSGIFTVQEMAWNEQRIQFKFSFHKRNYNDPSLNKRSTEIFGKSEPERFLKDYNGQTYWLSANLKSFFPKSKIPLWLNVAVGTGAEGMFGARDNYAEDKLGNIIFNRPDIQRYRQWYLSPDIDFTKIKTKKRGVKMLLNVLNVFKFPMPSLEYSKNEFNFNWFHF